MTSDDNQRHFQHWLDKNSWRRDLEAIKREYGTGATRGPDLAKSPINCPGAGEPAGSGFPPSQRYTDEFHFDAVSVIRYLGEALKYRPHAVPCPQCHAPVLTDDRALTHLCTVCEEIRGSQ